MLQLDGLHPTDRFKVQSIAERLFEISAGRLMTTWGLEADIGNLMVMTLPSCSDAGADAVLARVFRRADHYLGARGIVDIILDEIEKQGALQ
jgi:hypothetical protein